MGLVSSGFMRLLFKRLRHSGCIAALAGTGLTLAPRALTAATFAALLGLLLAGRAHAVICARSVCGLRLHMRLCLRCLHVFRWRSAVRRTNGRAFTTATATASAVAAFTALTGRTVAGVAVSVVG